ncbi:MAG: HD-GYP domain-containing protein, partial [Thermodesulfovibrionales bacterium]
VMNKSKSSYGEADLEIIKYLADQAAISIERSGFYEDQKNFEIHITDILLDTIDRFLPEKQGHSRRVAKYANMIAKALELPDERKRRLYIASLLHDIGFLRIPSERSFDREYFTLHPVIGYEMLKPISFYIDISTYVLYHHERYDGGGYPENRKAEEIPLESRIIAIAEAFDSMVSKITYKSRKNMDEAIDELITNRGKQFDPELVDLFVKNIREPID